MAQQVKACYESLVTKVPSPGLQEPHTEAHICNPNVLETKWWWGQENYPEPCAEQQKNEKRPQGVEGGEPVPRKLSSVLTCKYTHT